MKCLILGGGGFLGGHLAEALVAQGHGVRIFERPNLRRPAFASSVDQLEWFEGDFVNREDIALAIQGCEIIFHLISTTLPKSSNDNPVFDVETNVVGTLYLLDLMRKAGGKKIIFSSSGGTIYGTPQEVPIKETHPSNPMCSYGIVKLTIEKYLNLYRDLYGMDFCVLRFSNPFGERQNIERPQGAIGVFLRKALRNEPVEIWGDGSVVRDYIYVKDAVDAFLKAMSYQDESRIFNIGAGYGKSLNDVLSAIERIVGRPVNRAYLPARNLDVPVNILDISKANALLGWRPQVSFEEGLARTYSWALKQCQ